jgi:hypothetical protein
MDFSNFGEFEFESRYSFYRNRTTEVAVSNVGIIKTPNQPI